MTENETLADRLKEMLKKRGMNAKTLAHESGLSTSALSFILSGRTQDLKFQNVLSLSKALDCDPIWLMTGAFPYNVKSYDDNATPPNGIVAIGQYHIDVSAGPGVEYVPEDDSRPYWYHDDYFRQLGVKPNNCRKLRVSGDSMAPLIRDGDWVLIDCDPAQQIVDGDIYAFYQQGQGLRVKRVHTTFKGGLILHSDNDKYEDEHYDADESQYFNLIGRVLERSGSVH